MIEHALDTKNSILHIRPLTALEQEDFAKLAKAVDPHIEATGGLAGIIIEIAEFPGWENLAAMAAHLRFVRGHHEKVRKIAAVTDSAIGKVAEKIASHFVAAEIKRFPAGDVEAARRWILGRG
jgi:hypothetical protein